MCACVCLQNRGWPVFVLFVRALMFWSVRKDLTAKERGWEEEAVCGILTIGWRINQHLRERLAASAHYVSNPHPLSWPSIGTLFVQTWRAVYLCVPPLLPFFCCCPLDSSTWLSDWMSWSDTYSTLHRNVFIILLGILVQSEKGTVQSHLAQFVRGLRWLELGDSLPGYVNSL